MMERKLKRNITVLYIFSFFWMSMIIIPIIVPFFESKGLTLSQVFYLQAIFAFFVVVFEIPSGYVADMLGRKNALLAGSLFHGLGYSWLYFADSFVGLVAFEMLVGIGLSLLSGADLSLLYDSQEALGQSPEEKTRGIANMRFSKSVAEGVSALIGGVLIAWSFEVTVIANAMAACVPLVLACFLVEAPFTKMAKGQHKENLKEVVYHLFVRDRFLRLICLNTTFFGLATFYVVWMLQPYWREQGIPLTAFGLLWAAQSFLFAAATKACIPLEKRFGARPLLIVMGLLPIFGYIGMSSLGGVLGILLSFSFFLCRGINQVLLTDALNSRVSSSFRATANSMTSFTFRFIYIVTGPIVGLMIDKLGMQVTLFALGILGIGLFLTALLPLLKGVEEVEQANRELLAKS
ncbi:MAG: MFS family permease [Candidatus Azotimanducaceae bacterium]|jgi:MFS family permease